MAKIFISHSWNDNERLREMVGALRSANIDFWFDRQNVGPGNNIPWRISDGLNSCTHLLVCWSKASMESWVVRDEIGAFYMLHPQPDLILFLRLDDTKVMTIFAARTYVNLGSSCSEAVAAIRRWLGGIPDATRETPSFEYPLGSVLHQFPKGPMVRGEWVSMDLVNAYAKIYGGGQKAIAIVGEANRMRLDADPQGNPDNMLVELSMVIANTPFNFWQSVFDNACRKSPRMVGALLFVMDDELLPRQARQDRVKLINEMRKMWLTR